MKAERKNRLENLYLNYDAEIRKIGETGKMSEKY